MKYFLFIIILLSGYAFSEPYPLEYAELKVYNQKLFLSLHFYNKKNNFSKFTIIEPNATVYWQGHIIPRGGLSFKRKKTIKASPKSSYHVEFDMTDTFDFREGLHDYTFSINNYIFHKKGHTQIKFKFNNVFRKPVIPDKDIISEVKM